jgi:hypothetical protein
MNWLDDDSFVCLQADSDGTTKLFWASVKKTIGGGKLGDAYYVAGTIPATAANLKVVKLDGKENELGVVVSALAGRDGKMWTVEDAKR